MDLDHFRQFCMSLRGTEESMPFDDSTLVMKVGGKIYACAGIIPFERVAVKCDPQLAIEYREASDDITPAFHFNKRYWNDVYVGKGLSTAQVEVHIRNSYELVRNGLPKRVRESLEQSN